MSDARVHFCVELLGPARTTLCGAPVVPHHAKRSWDYTNCEDCRAVYADMHRRLAPGSVPAR